MNDQQKTTSDVQKRADALLAEIRAENDKFASITSSHIVSLESELSSLETDLDKMEKDLEAFGGEVSAELEADAALRERELEASAAADQNL